MSTFSGLPDYHQHLSSILTCCSSYCTLVKKPKTSVSLENLIIRSKFRVSYIFPEFWENPKIAYYIAYYNVCLEKSSETLEQLFVYSGIYVVYKVSLSADLADQNPFSGHTLYLRVCNAI